MLSQQPQEGSAASEQMTARSPLCLGSLPMFHAILQRLLRSLSSLTLGLWLSSGAPEWRKSETAAGLGEEPIGSPSVSLPEPLPFPPLGTGLWK